MAETIIRSRIDTALKIEAQALLERLGLSMSEAIRLFLHQVVIEKGLPFSIRLSEEEARAHDRWYRSQVQAALEEADNPDTAFTPHEVVRKKWTARRQLLAEQIEPEQSR